MENIDPPEEKSIDYIADLFKTVIEIAPGGSLVTYGLSQFVQHPYQVRLNNWMKDISEMLKGHEKKLLELKSNERFVTIFLQAGQIAVRNHHEEKLKALKQAVVNSITPPNYDDSIQVHFLHLVDRFTHWHLKVLTLIGNPEILFKMKQQGAGSLNAFNFIQKVLPINSDLLEMVLIDLINCYLVLGYTPEAERASGRGQGVTPILSKIGQDFLDFINE